MGRKMESEFKMGETEIWRRMDQRDPGMYVRASMVYSARRGMGVTSSRPYGLNSHFLFEGSQRSIVILAHDKGHKAQSRRFYILDYYLVPSEH
jgi:hypothetical protein